MQEVSINIRIIRVILISLFFGFLVNAFTYICCTLIGWPGEFSWLWDSNLRDFSEMMRSLFSTTGAPYIILGIFWIIVLRNKEVEYYKHKRKGLIGAFIGIVIINVLLYSAFYLDMLIGDVSLTGALVFIFPPFYAVICGVVGFGIGYSIALKIEEKKN